MLRDWKELPKKMQTKAVAPYYLRLRTRGRSLRAKRLFDVTAALFLLVLLAPLMGGLALAIKLEDRGPVLYRQQRITAYGKRFRICKFRTMVPDADKKGPLITGKEDERITRVGRRIRRFRLDELPQLFNILTGDMSFVGVRPEVEKYVEAYTGPMWATLLLPAGVTSPASIAFRKEEEILEACRKKGESVDQAYVDHILPAKMAYNLAYLEKVGIWTDCKVLLRTVWEVFR